MALPKVSGLVKRIYLDMFKDLTFLLLSVYLDWNAQNIEWNGGKMLAPFSTWDKGLNYSTIHSIAHKPTYVSC